MLRDKSKLAHEDWEKLPTWLQDEYGADEGGTHALKPAAVDASAEARLKKIRETADTNARKVAELQAIVDALPKDENDEAIDPAKLTEMLEQMREQQASGVKGSDKIREAVDRAVTDARKKWDKDKAAVDRELAEERTANHELLVINTVKGWVGSNISPDHQDTVTDHLLSRLQPQVRREVKDGKATRRAITAVDGFDEDLTGYLDDKWKSTDVAKRYLRAPDMSGADKGDGTKPKSETTPAKATSKSQFKTQKEKSDFIDAHGYEAYAKLPTS